MGVVASVHITDLGVLRTLPRLRSVPRPGSIGGLRHAEVAVAAPLRARRGPPIPTFSRVALIALWDSDDAVSEFLGEHRLAAKFASGWHARLEPLRAFGAWPGLPDDLSRDRTTDYDGPAVVLTLGRVRISRVPRFLRTSRRAETSANASPGMLWGTALARPPFVATCSVWESTRALAAYAYGQRDPGHPEAITADRSKPFHRRSAFVRFRPYAMNGSLAGKNPLPESVVAQVTTGARDREHARHAT